LIRPVHYRTNLIILFVITLGLVFMGMRLPNLQELASSSSKPKPRPRAVIKVQVKSSQEQNKKILVDVSSDGPVRNALADRAEFAAPFGILTAVRAPLNLFVSSTLSRAPPSHA